MSKLRTIVETQLANAKQQHEAMQTDLRNGLTQIETLKENIAAIERFATECESALADEKSE